MPITLTVPELARRIRIDLTMIAEVLADPGDPNADPPIPAVAYVAAHADPDSLAYLDLADLLDSSSNEVLQYAGSATPPANLNTAVARLVGYVWDSPGSWRNVNFASAFLNSGAAHALNPWRDATGRRDASDAPQRPLPDVVPDMSPTDTDALMRAIADYFAAHPPPAGPRGNPGADSVVPGPRGNPGADSTVPGPRGLPGPASTVAGPPGRPPTAAEIADALATYLAANPIDGAGRAVHQIGGNIEPVPAHANGAWVSFDVAADFVIN